MPDMSLMAFGIVMRPLLSILQMVGSMLCASFYEIMKRVSRISCFKTISIGMGYLTDTHFKAVFNFTMV